MKNISETNRVNRRKILTAFGIAGFTAASGSALGSAKMGEAELKSKLADAQSINYKMFGAVGDGKNDDSIQIKEAHAYANKMNLPVINQSGEYWLKQANNIEIMTNVDWGSTIFHIEEKTNSAANGRFRILPGKEKKAIELTEEQKSAFIKQLKPGVKLIPEMAAYKNCLISVADKNDQIGFRAGAKFEGQSWAREELFCVEEHGSIIGDIAWEFKGYTSLFAYPIDTSYLTINGGTFYLSGDSNGKTYVKCGFSITRSRTIIQNQWVGLEPGKADVSKGPRSGFYTFSYAYDVKLENVRLIPFEQDRDGTANDVPQGTYGISAARVLNLVFRNVTAEGGPVHWGVFGTNLNKNFHIENCRLNRVDVHFHCSNLHIKDSNIGYRGISVTGGGDLIIENTSCYSRSFINFRRDFGAKWDGHIRLRNCRFIPAATSETAVLDFNPADFDYRYPLGFGRSLIVQNMVVDFTSTNGAANTVWLMKLPAFSKAKSGRRLFFPQYLEFRNIIVHGRQQGLRLLSIANPRYYQLDKPGGYDGVFLTTNSQMLFDQVDLEDLSAREPSSRSPQAHLSIADASAPYTDAYALYPKVSIKNCRHVVADFGNNVVEANVEHSILAKVAGNSRGAMPGRFDFSNCLFRPAAPSAEKVFYALESELGTSFTNCTFHAPIINGNIQPELFDLNGCVEVNKVVKYNHLNTQLGNDVINYYKSKNIAFNPKFIAILKNHHQLEPENV